MIKIFVFFVLFSFFNISYSGTLLKHDLDTSYYLSYQSKNPKNVIIVALHGGGGHAEHIANDRNYGFISLADKQNWSVLFPNGYSSFNGKFATWNAGDCCGKARDENIDHVKFLKNVIDDFVSKNNIKNPQVFMTGMSNGAMMSYHFACHHPEMLKGITAVAGTDNSNCNPRKPLPILHIHSKDDTHVLYQGGAGKDAFRNKETVTEFKSVEETFDKWKVVNLSQNPIISYQQNDVSCFKFNGVKVFELCSLHSGGHSWPGSNSWRKESNQNLDATSYIGEFFTRQLSK